MNNVSHIWVDAICINQSDDEEQMWDIYQSAQLVVMWMGSGNTATNNFMEMMQNTISREANECTEDDNMIYVDRIRIPGDFSALDELQRLAEKAYWARAWIRQEINSHDSSKLIVVYGRRMVGFKILDLLVRAVKNMAKGNSIRSPVCVRTPHQEAIWQLAGSPAFRVLCDALDSSLDSEKLKLLHILYTWVRKIYLWGDGLHTSDPRDLIFSLLLMMTWREQGGPRMYPDYTVDARQVYIRIAKEWPNICIWRSPPGDDNDSAALGDLNLPSWSPTGDDPFDLPTWSNFRCGGTTTCNIPLEPPSLIRASTRQQLNPPNT